jgi:hypothetical protein
VLATTYDALARRPARVEARYEAAWLPPAGVAPVEASCRPAAIEAVEPLALASRAARPGG